MPKAKAIIQQVGSVYLHSDGTSTIANWSFDCRGEVAALEILEDGTVLYGGYTVEELVDIVDGTEGPA